MVNEIHVDFMEISSDDGVFVGLWNLICAIVMYIQTSIVVVRTLEYVDLKTYPNICATHEE